MITEERQRQILAEDWTPEHDDEHDKKELAQGAACYVLDYTQKYNLGRAWPWWDGDDADGWKPTPDDPIRQLVKAGAFIAAEIDRLLRKEEKK